MAFNILEQKMKYGYILVFFVAIIFVIVGCEESNNPPSTPVITPSSTMVETNQNVNITAIAIDPDNDPITYDWQATGGSFNTTSGNSVVWVAPTVAGTYTITVNAKDSHGASSASSINSVNITVFAGSTPGGGGNIPGGGGGGNTPTYNFSTNGLVGYWSFDQGAIVGNMLKDLWGGNNGTIIGGPRSVVGKVGESLSFDGVDDYVDCGDSASLNITGNITVEFWMNPVDGNVNRHVISKGQMGAGGYWVQHGGSLANETNFIYFYAQQVYQGGIAPKGTTTLNTWQHIVVTYDGPSVRVYKDSILINTEVATNNPIKPSSRRFTIGKYAAGNTNYFKGMLDEIRIYNRALTEGEVQQNYNAR